MPLTKDKIKSLITKGDGRVTLCDNTITDADVPCIVETIKENKAIKQLNLRGTQIGNKGAAALAEMLKTNRTLEILHLSDNKFHDNGTIALAQALEINTTLKSLALSHTMLGTKGTKALAQMLKQNTTLRHLYLPADRLSYISALELRSALRVNQSLTLLGIDKRNMSEPVEKVFESLLARGNTESKDPKEQEAAKKQNETRNKTLLGLKISSNKTENRAILDGLCFNKNTVYSLAYLILNDTRITDTLSLDNNKITDVKDRVCRQI